MSDITLGRYVTCETTEGTISGRVVCMGRSLAIVRTVDDDTEYAVPISELELPANAAPEPSRPKDQPNE